MLNEDDEQTMEITQFVRGLGAEMTMSQKSIARHVSLAAVAQVRTFKPFVNSRSNSHTTGSSPHSSSAHFSPAVNAPTPDTPVAHWVNSKDISEALTELGDETSNQGAKAGNSFRTDEEPQPFDGGEGGGEDSMDLTDTYQVGTPLRRLLRMVPLPPLDRSVDQRDLSRASDADQIEESAKDKYSGEFMVKAGKSIVPRQKSEAWVELQSLTNAGEGLDDDSMGGTDTANLETQAGFIPAPQNSQSGIVFSSQGTYTSYGMTTL